jgi:peptidoglycan hydrolase-like protein with peptidoglycan-binding domain
MRRPASLPPLAVLAALAVAPAAAQAQQPPAPPAAAPAPAPAPAVTPSLHVVTEKVNGANAAIVTRTRFRVRVIVKPYVAGQQVTISFTRGGRAVKTTTATVRQGRTAGQAVVGYAPRSTGRLTVQAVHAATPELPQLNSQTATVDVLPRSASTRSAVRTLQSRLARLGYVVGARGRLDDRTLRAVTAFRKVTGMPRTTSADVNVFRALARGEGAFTVRHRNHGKHVEADLSRQVIALIGAGGKVERIYPTSSGAPATPTILGSYRVYMKDPGTNAKGMVASSYFIRGYAIHGYASVPVFNASHGCLRVPIPDAYSIFAWVTMGTIVDVYP